ncbi:Rossmann-like and DUF2520 domain-containing protein [Prevotella melaninogenica]|uniref:DUF2520 domain-containing protein n=1 Tax=Prevotella melaninogenica TaxID=28132 RepID=A0A7D4K9C7_9BACT|nr:Rossmann-like and DUF2520 domain-containing protein [Prevotella melaninogenica]EFC73436.1 hypothetical protein HMPREF0660_00916 [Prevotella melaninogenica D18]QKH87542.1 DUF2520 domain-containing protein [Prevotella melaninogenica]
MMKVTLIGAGNLATQLGKSLKKAGVIISQVYSRTEDSARTLGKLLEAEWLTDIKALRDEADIYIFSVKDSVLCELISEVCKGRGDKLFLHTAGSMSMSCFEGKVLRYGVFYPMQTFSKTKDVDFERVPVFIEGNSIETEDIIRSFANMLSKRVITLSSADRKYLHLAAVWACNFTNYCYTVASDILGEHGIPFDVMLPLINETTEKIQKISPKEAQTGPAVRGDRNVMSKQLELMNDKEDLQKLYKMLSKGINPLVDNLTLDKR